MKIGAKVLVSALIQPDYISGDRIRGRGYAPERIYRLLLRSQFDQPVEMYYTGYTFRQEGIYSEARIHSPTFLIPADADPPFLKVTRTVRVARVKRHERENDKFCFMEDMKEVDNG